MKYVELNDSLLKIGEYTFADCTSLDSLYIPPSVTKIGKGAFDNCRNLVIQCEEESYAHNYAEKHNIEYQLV